MHSSVHYEKPRGKGHALFYSTCTPGEAGALRDCMGYVPHIAFLPRDSVYC
jgi:hypothetical protein